MEMNEKIAQSIRNEDSESKDKKEEKCKFIARAKRPSGKGPWYSGGKLGGIEDGDDLTGHSFCALEDEGGNRSWYGFYPKGAIIGWDSVPEEDRISGALDFFKYVAGILYHGDEDHEYDDEKFIQLRVVNMIRRKTSLQNGLQTKPNTASRLIIAQHLLSRMARLVMFLCQAAVGLLRTRILLEKISQSRSSIIRRYVFILTLSLQVTNCFPSEKGNTREQMKNNTNATTSLIFKGSGPGDEFGFNVQN